MCDINDVNMFLSDINIFKKLYEVVRIVDPIKKQVLQYNEITSKIDYLNSNCFDFWKRDSICSNCVSMRAFNENKTFVKIEYNGEKVNLVTAIPVECQGRKIIIEGLKDITDTGIIENIHQKDINTIYNIINNMNELVIKDELTKLYNKRYIRERLPVDIIKSKLQNTPLSIILIDIDRFKYINDNYGHSTGDYVLEKIGEIIKKSLKNNLDWAARYGGDEFIICLDNLDEKGSFIEGEKLRELINNETFIYNGQEIRVTISVGGATLLNKDLSLEEFFDIADKNLYISKKEGRNKTTI